MIFLAAFVFVSLTPEFLHRHDFDRAFMAYYRNPTLENSAALRGQRRINDCINLSSNGVAALALTSCGYGIYGLIHSISSGVKRARAFRNQA